MGEYRPEHIDENPREAILKLGQMITDRMGVKVTASDPEYWGLAPIVTDEMAEVALKMGKRKPRTVPQIQKLTGMDREALQKLLDEMALVGIVEYNYENLDGKNPQHERRYVVPPFVPGSAEFANMNTAQLEAHPELGPMFEQLSRLPLQGSTHMIPPGGAGCGMHVIPVEKAIEHESVTSDLEHISYWLKKYDRYAASPCSCRLSRRTFGEGCGDDPMDWCIAVGDMAEYVVDTKKGGRYITYDEVLEILRRAEENGFVHQITNIDGKDKIFAICNCNVNVCYALRTSQLFNTPNLSRSAYVAKVDPEKCVACGRCVENCPAGAVRLGQKLCTKQGPMVYPRIEDPAVTKWDESKWDWNYRDTNRRNCYDTGTSPCKTACPAHIAVQGYLKMAREGRYTEALQLIKRENPFPAVCGRVCKRYCEEKCTRGTVDQAVAIDEVKRFIAQKDLDAETRFIPQKVIHKVVGEFPEKIAVIGGGPAGLSCAFYLAEQGYRPTVFEKTARAGGMMMNGIPSFRLEKDVVQAEIDIIREMGVEIRTGVEVGRDVTIPQLREQGYKAFFISIGAQGGRMLNVPGENAEGVVSAVDFMLGLSLDETKKLSGKTIVIGGGNVATDAARAAVRAGAESVELFCLEAREEMPATVDEIAETEKEGIVIHNSRGPVEVLQKDGHVSAVRFRRCLTTRNAEGKFAPTFDDNDMAEAEADNVILAIGQSIIWGDLLKDTKVELNPNGTAKADPLTRQTAEPDIFVGGDVFTGPMWTIDAIAGGKEGAVSLHRFVQKGTSLTIGRNRRQYIELDKNNIVLSPDGYDHSPRQMPGYEESLRRTFRDGSVCFTEEQVKKEASRCLSCGASVVDPNKCIGCGQCTTKCSFDAIHLHREHPECTSMNKVEDRFKKILPYAAKREIKILLSQNKKNKTGDSSQT